MKLHFERVEAGAYIWLTSDKVITVSRYKSKWCVVFRDRNTGRHGIYDLPTLKKGIEFANFHFEDFSAMLID